MNWVREYTPNNSKNQLYRRALVITVTGNIALAVGKGIAAYLSGSVALYADAANSVSDVLYSLLMVSGHVDGHAPAGYFSSAGSQPI
jgi:divalent metal cation (Fe/Co/Zn/Cd) transporter